MMITYADTTDYAGEDNIAPVITARLVTPYPGTVEPRGGSYPAIVTTRTGDATPGMVQLSPDGSLFTFTTTDGTTTNYHAGHDGTIVAMVEDDGTILISKD